MAASDELPRGWVQSNNVGTGSVSVTYPAAVGIAWVATRAHGVLLAGAAGLALFSQLIINGQVVDEGGFNNSVAFQNFSLDWEGQIIIATNTALVVTVSGGAGISALVEAQAYPI